MIDNGFNVGAHAPFFIVPDVGPVLPTASGFHLVAI